mmetsp:Transcript_81858/g.222170  ORF Transcript_81858/g.222170 Transcript_81858/m.222170 type:complete len:230 (-) Transcript_81858:343-1032(-)
MPWPLLRPARSVWSGCCVTDNVSSQRHAESAGPRRHPNMHTVSIHACGYPDAHRSTQVARGLLPGRLLEGLLEHPGLEAEALPSALRPAPALGVPGRAAHTAAPGAARRAVLTAAKPLVPGPRPAPRDPAALLHADLEVQRRAAGTRSRAGRRELLLGAPKICRRARRRPMARVCPLPGEACGLPGEGAGGPRGRHQHPLQRQSVLVVFALLLLHGSMFAAALSPAMCG